jgi:hypothetical protein
MQRIGGLGEGAGFASELKRLRQLAVPRDALGANAAPKHM